MTNKSLGFTLVELSLVIVIIALVISTISAGQSLVKNAKIRSTISEITQLRTAYNSFRLEYNAMPGDFDEASAYWPSAVNGDGNGLIGSWHMFGTEPLQAFYQLSQAGLISGSYTGTGSAGNVFRGINAQGSAINSTAIYYFYADDLWGKYPKGNAIALSTPDATYTSVGVKTVDVNDAKRIDTKIDDSKPGLGTVIAFNADGGSPPNICTNLHMENVAYDKYTSYYVLDTNTKCIMHFSMPDFIYK